MRQFLAAAIQMIGPPDHLCGGISDFRWGELSGARALNGALIQGTAQEVRRARGLLEAFDVRPIVDHSVARMVDLLNQAADQGCRLAVFPELALTSFFPYLYIEDPRVLRRFFLEGDPREGPAAPVFQVARHRGINVALGYAQIDEAGRRWNCFGLFDARTGDLHRYKKTHLPGFEVPRPREVSFQFEKGMFEASSEGYPVFDLQEGRYGMLICHDRRYSNPYLAMGMATGKNVEIILNGYNTPFDLTFAGAGTQDRLDNRVYEFHYLPQQAQAITEGTYIFSVAIAGPVLGTKQIAGTCIIAPDGTILAKQEGLVESVLCAEVDLDRCREVRLQKYLGDRCRPEVLLEELIRAVGPDRAGEVLAKVRARG